MGGIVMKATLDFRDDLIDKEVAEKLSKEVTSYIIEQVKNNMKTIKERAKEYSKGQWDEPTANKAYIDGAKEQKTIDIEKAKTAFSKACGWLSTYPWYNGVFEEFIKNIEE